MDSNPPGGDSFTALLGGRRGTAPVLFAAACETARDGLRAGELMPALALLADTRPVGLVPAQITDSVIGALTRRAVTVALAPIRDAVRALTDRKFPVEEAARGCRAPVRDLVLAAAARGYAPDLAPLTAECERDVGPAVYAHVSDELRRGGAVELGRMLGRERYRRLVDELAAKTGLAADGTELARLAVSGLTADVLAGALGVWRTAPGELSAEWMPVQLAARVLLASVERHEQQSQAPRV